MRRINSFVKSFKKIINHINEQHSKFQALLTLIIAQKEIWRTPTINLKLTMKQELVYENDMNYDKK